MPSERKLIVLAPVRNEAWCLDGFIKCALLWADAIVLSDQSDDDSVSELSSHFSNIHVITNDSREFNERENRLRLLKEGRRLYPGSVFIAIDADERLSGNILEAETRKKLLTLDPGTAVSIPFFNLNSRESGWEVPLDPICFVDDGREAEVDANIHFPRICIRNFDKVVDLGLKTLHLQYLNMERYESKMRWYQALEIVKFSADNPIRLFRRYQHLRTISNDGLTPLKNEWVAPYLLRGLDPLSFDSSWQEWWLQETQDLLACLDPESLHLFQNLNSVGSENEHSLGLAERLIFRYLRLTMPYFKGGRKSPVMLSLFVIDSMLSLIVQKFRPRI